MKIKRYTLIPLLLAVYTLVFAAYARVAYNSNDTSALSFWGTICINMGVIVLLHFVLKRNDRLRNERLKDIENNNKEQS